MAANRRWVRARGPSEVSGCGRSTAGAVWWEPHIWVLQSAGKRAGAAGHLAFRFNAADVAFSSSPSRASVSARCGRLCFAGLLGSRRRKRVHGAAHAHAHRH